MLCGRGDGLDVVDDLLLCEWPPRHAPPGAPRLAASAREGQVLGEAREGVELGLATSARSACDPLQRGLPCPASFWRFPRKGGMRN
eukprot:401144-Pyramimonas_sp.AAC.1